MKNKDIWIGTIVIIVLIIGGAFYWHYKSNTTSTVGTTASTEAIQNCMQMSGTAKDECFRTLVEQTRDSTLCANFSSSQQQKACQRFVATAATDGSGDSTTPPPPGDTGGGTPLPTQPPVTGTAIHDVAVHYGPDPKQELDVYSNTGFHNAPIAILVHGGSWVEGSKGDMTAVATNAFYPDGFVAVPIDYRLMNTNTLENDYPTGLNDVACAVAWVKANAAKYGGDPNKVILYGQSAGSHLTGIVAYDPEGPWLDGCQTQGQSLKVAGYMGSGGVYDFTLVRADQRWQPGCLLEQFLGLNSCGPRDTSWGDADPSKLKEASPIGHVSAGDPPGLFINGDNDCYVNYPDPGTGLCQANSVAMDAALKAAGVSSQLYTLHGYAHGDFKNAFGQNPNDFPTVLTFISQFK